MKVDSAEFELLPEATDWIVRVTVSGSDFLRRAVPVAARVGEQAVEGIALNPELDGFVGYLRAEPPDGAHLFVGYLQGELPDTDIEYHPPNV